MLRRLVDLLAEKSRDKNVRQACKAAGLAGRFLHRVHRLSVHFDGTEPRLDDTSSIPDLIAMTQSDPSLSAKIDVAARCMVASLFYFELDPDSPPQKRGGTYVLAGWVLCSVRSGDPALAALMNKLLSSRAEFLVDGRPIPSTAVCTPGSSRNVCIPVRAESSGFFTVSLKLGDAEACHISGSPFFVPKLIAAQRLDAPFGRPDHHRKRKALESGQGSASKRRRVEGWIA
jgi:hypothetical protein